jgi:radical SAM superfamily enzyme YgiQ (UPF0313 family)
LGLDGKAIRIGGPAVYMNMEWITARPYSWLTFTSISNNILSKHNSFATRTTKGCIKKCSFCAVPHIESKFEELEDYEIKPILIDNNLLACSKRHFDKVIDNFKNLLWCDFNQGLDIRLLNKYHAERFAELKNPIIRLAWDNIKDEKFFIRTYELLKKAGIPNKNIQVYVLIGFKDTPEDALYRLQKIEKLGLLPNPMRYQPIRCKIKNDYVGENWTDKELKRFMRYWSRLIFFKRIKGIEFKDFIK